MEALRAAGQLTESSWALKCRWLLPGNGVPRADVTITVAGDKVAAIEPLSSATPALDWGPVVVLPGLVNAHTHLEFGGRETPVGEARQGFAAWLREVIAQRRAQLAQATDEQLRAERAASTARSLAELTGAGVTTVAEIARLPWDSAMISDSPECWVFLELLGLAPERVEPLLQAARAHLDGESPGKRDAPDRSPGWRAGLSPHAPYTVHPDLLAGACRLSQERRIPLAMHLAESWDELELLASHSGPLVEVLDEFGAWNPGFLPRGLRPQDYLACLAEADRSLIVHGNFLDRPEWEFLAARRDRMSLVYCPRTHDRFLAARYPLAEALAAGVRVVLGTDSRATNPDLDFLEELRWTARRHPNVSPADVLAMGTAHAAQALGEPEKGVLAAEKAADFVVLDVGRSTEDPWEWLTGDQRPRVLAVVHRGKATPLSLGESRGGKKVRSS